METVIERDGRYYYVSTKDTFDEGWETMIFACTADGGVTSWADLYRRNYSNEKAAIKGHKQAIKEFQPRLSASREATT